MLTDLLRGASYLWRGFSLIRQPVVRRYVVVPLMINTLLFALLIWYGSSQLSTLIDWLLPAWLEWLRWLLWPLFAVAVLLISFHLFTITANVVGAPFNGLLAEAVERHLLGTIQDAGGGGRALAAVVPALAAELQKLLYFVKWALPLALLFLVPVVNMAAPIIWMGFTAWMLALEYADYPMSNHNLLFPEQRARLRRDWPMALGFGGAALVLMMIPIVNFVMMPTAVAGATAMWVARLDRVGGGR